MNATVLRTLITIACVVTGLPPQADATEAAWKRLHRVGVEKYRAFDYAGAAEALRQSVAEATAAGDEKGTAAALHALADALLVLGRDEEAEGAYRREMQVAARGRPAAERALNATRWSLYALETSLGRHEEAGRIFRQVVEESPRPIATTLVLVDASDINKVTLLSAFPIKYAEPVARRALRIHERVYGADRTAGPLSRLAAVLRELHRDEEVLRLEARLLALGDGPPAGR